MIRTLLPYLLVTVLALLLGAAALQLFRGKQAETTARAEATVLLERVRQVCQLVTVEGEFSETYNEKEYQKFYPLPAAPQPGQFLAYGPAPGEGARAGRLRYGGRFSQHR